MGPVNHNITHRFIAIDSFTDERSIKALKFLFSCSIYSIEMTVFGIGWFHSCRRCCFKKKRPEFSWEFPITTDRRNRKYIPNKSRTGHHSINIVSWCSKSGNCDFQMYSISTNSEPLIIRLLLCGTFFFLPSISTSNDYNSRADQIVFVIFSCAGELTSTIIDPLSQSVNQSASWLSKSREIWNLNCILGYSNNPTT